ncbi:MAG TPA: response regulator [Povalibacter sp.]|nr:response regulator [Povalibacter sp.]
MRIFRRSLVALAVAAILPTVLFSAVGLFYFLRTARAQVETATLARSEAVMGMCDTALRSELRVLNVLSTSVFFESERWHEFLPRVRRVLDANPHWVAVRIFDVATGTELLDTLHPQGVPAGAPITGTATLETMRNMTGPLVGGVQVETEPVIYLYAPVMRDGHARYVVAAAVKTQPFQDMLMSQVSPHTVAGIVDSRSNFIARSLNYEDRVGRPATSFVSEALRHSTHGLYRGTTYEGFRNYTAFHVSPWSGWSAHIAMASTLIDRPTMLSFVVAGIAGLGGVLLAAILVTLVLRDMAERRRAEEALRQSQKMEAIGQLTGGIAHDFNNLLTAVIGNLDMIRSRSKGNERLERLADHALEAARRGAKLTSQLLAFSRSQRMQLTSIDLDALLSGMTALLSQSLGPTVQLRIDVSRHARFVISDGNQLELALLNLAVNARDAMPDGGELSISSQPATDLDLRDLPRRSYVEIRVRDTGIGMEESVRARAIEPFFTTKQVGHGTGLGLSQVYGTARESGGKLFIESSRGAGTTIRLVLPLAETPSPSVTAASVGENTVTVPAPVMTPKSILVVDDDRQVRRFISESLRQLAYHVVAVSNGAEALERLLDERFDLLLADFAMPGMNGAEVARAAQQIDSHLKVLIVSGYANSAAIEAALGATPVLRKPFDTQELGLTVKRIIEDGSSELIISNRAPDTAQSPESPDT